MRRASNVRTKIREHIAQNGSLFHALQLAKGMLPRDTERRLRKMVLEEALQFTVDSWASGYGYRAANLDRLFALQVPVAPPAQPPAQPAPTAPTVSAGHTTPDTGIGIGFTAARVAIESTYDHADAMLAFLGRREKAVA